MVGMYEPYVEVCRRLAELSPGSGEYKSVLLNSGAEAVENAVKIARAATGRPAVIAFDRAFHGRTLLTMSLTSKVVPYKRGLRPVRARGLPRAGAVRGPRRSRSDDAIAACAAFKADVDPESVACVVLEPVQGEGGFIPMPRDFPRRLQELCGRTGSSTSTTRSRPASAAPARCGRSSTTASSPTCSSRQVARRRAAAGRGHRAAPS